MPENIKSAVLLAFKAAWAFDKGKLDLATAHQAKGKCPLVAIDVYLKSMQILAGQDFLKSNFCPVIWGILWPPGYWRELARLRETQ